MFCERITENFVNVHGETGNGFSLLEISIIYYLWMLLENALAIWRRMKVMSRLKRKNFFRKLKYLIVVLKLSKNVFEVKLLRKASAFVEL